MQTQDIDPKEPKFRLSVQIAAYSLIILVSLVVMEMTLRYLYPAEDAARAAREAGLYAKVYSKEELRKDLPQYTERQGQNCIRQRTGPHWDPRFGYSVKQLDKQCAKKLFELHPNSVVMMGGSAMANPTAPNYMTTLETYAFGDDPTFASVNLAESAANQNNMLARFLYEVVELRPKFAVFLAGANEFNAVRIGGDPEDDYFWTAFVRDRLSSRTREIMMQSLARSSRIVETLATSLGLVRSPAQRPANIPKALVKRAADYFLKSREHTEIICRAYNIKCIFIIQPISLLESNPSRSTRMIADIALKANPQDGELYRYGYDYILSHSPAHVHNATHIFDGQEDIYFDAYHFSKPGSQILGKYIRQTIETARAQ